MRRSWFVCCALLYSACGHEPAAVYTPTSPVQDTLRVLSLNILYGGDEIDFSKVVESIQVSGADVVGVQEAEGRIPVLAAALGWPHYSTRLHLVSRYPIIAPAEGEWQYAYIQLRPGAVVAMSNIHLPSDPYGPEAVRDGAPAEAVMQLEMTVRYPELATHREKLPPLFQNHGLPVFLTGDFNAPSHRDWTPATVNQRKHLRYPMAWPVSQNLESLGFRDAYREVFPDPVLKPGLTWTPGYPPPTVSPDETHDRIDFVWVAGPVQVLDCRIVGESDGPDVDVAVSPYATDHRGVLTRTAVTAGAPSPYIAAERPVFSPDERPMVYFGSNGEKPRKIILQRSDKEQITVASNTLPFFGEYRLDGPLDTGRYTLQLIGTNNNVLATNTFWIQAPDARPEVLLTKTVFKKGEPIPVQWKKTPGNKFDWLAIYPAEADTWADYDCFITYLYTRGMVEGDAVFDEKAFGRFADLTPGHYKIHFLSDDGYRSSASVAITVAD